MPGPNGKQVSCCGPDWEAILRNRVGQMMDNYLQGGRAAGLLADRARPSATRPASRSPTTVNEAITQAARRYGGAVRVIDLPPTFTPGDSYRDAIVDRRQQTIVRDARRHPPERGRLVRRRRPRPAGRRPRLRLLTAPASVGPGTQPGSVQQITVAPVSPRLGSAHRTTRGDQNGFRFQLQAHTGSRGRAAPPRRAPSTGREGSPAPAIGPVDEALTAGAAQLDRDGASDVCPPHARTARSCPRLEGPSRLAPPGVNQR